MNTSDTPFYKKPLFLLSISFTFFFLLFLYFVRPLGIIHGPLLWLDKYPLHWFLPLITFLISFLLLFCKQIFSLTKKKEDEEDEQEKEEDPSDLYSYRYSYYSSSRRSNLQVSPWTEPWKWAVICVLASLAFLFSTIYAPMATNRAIYEHYAYSDLAELPEQSQVRILPKAVADQLASSGFNSSTEKLSDGHIVKNEDGSLVWSYEAAPDGLFRQFTKKSAGVAQLDAATTSRDIEIFDEEFDVAPGMQLTDNLKWDAYKMNYFSSLPEASFIVTKEGEPLIIAPYIKYEGFPIATPVLGGVYVVHADGEIEDLSPQEASERPEVFESGRLFPEALARQIMDAYAYKDGIWNKLFIHDDQTEINDTENNPQPYLMELDGETKWVATAEPYGNSSATRSIFMTDTITGETEIWDAPENSALTGNQKALDIVKGLSIPGINFSGGSGQFVAVEPRPLFVDSELKFLISIIPDSENLVSKSVIIDAASNKAEAIFAHDIDAQADEDLKDYLQTGEISEAAELDSDPLATTPPTLGEEDENSVPDTTDLSDAELSQLLQELQENNEEEQKILEALTERLAE